jgi:hypothetical protein
MTSRGKGLLIGAAIAAAMCAAFLVRWLTMPPQGGWRLSADGSSWEASRDINGAAILPERKYCASGTGTAPAEMGWRIRPSDTDAPERTGTAGGVAAGQWELTFRAGAGAPRRATVVVHVTPANAVDGDSLRLELSR